MIPSYSRWLQVGSCMPTVYGGKFNHPAKADANWRNKRIYGAEDSSVVFREKGCVRWLRREMKVNVGNWGIPPNIWIDPLIVKGSISLGGCFSARAYLAFASTNVHPQSPQSLKLISVAQQTPNFQSYSICLKSKINQNPSLGCHNPSATNCYHLNPFPN